MTEMNASLRRGAQIAPGDHPLERPRTARRLRCRLSACSAAAARPSAARAG